VWPVWVSDEPSILLAEGATRSIDDRVAQCCLWHICGCVRCARPRATTGWVPLKADEHACVCMRGVFTHSCDKGGSRVGEGR